MSETINIPICPTCRQSTEPVIRKAAQIATLYIESQDRVHAPQFITTVIADDGTMWELIGNGSWAALPPLPQGPVAGGGE